MTLLSSLTPAAASASEIVEPPAPLGGGAEVAVDSRYIWRGVAYSNGPVLTPSVWLSTFGLTAVGWATTMLNHEMPGSAITSAGGFLRYSLDIWHFRLEPAVWLYAAPNDAGAPSTAEAAFDVSYFLGDWQFFSRNNVDFFRVPGGYFGAAGAAFEHSLHRVTLRAVADIAYATLPYNRYYLESRGWGPGLFEVGGTFRYDINDILYVTLHTELSAFLQPALRREVDEPILVNGGAAVGAEF